MNSLVRVGTAALTVVLGACASSETVSPPGEPGANIPIVRLHSEPYSFAFNSGLDKPDRIVVRDATSWQAVWRDVWRGGSEIPPLPAVDFSREMILVVALGARSTGGYGILIDGANEAGQDKINVAVRSISPGNCGVTLAFTQPVDIARLPLRTGSVGFTERSEVSRCQ